MKPLDNVCCMQALGIALKLSLQGQNQFIYSETYYCILVSFSIYSL